MRLEAKEREQCEARPKIDSRSANYRRSKKSSSSSSARNYPPAKTPPISDRLYNLARSKAQLRDQWRQVEVEVQSTFSPSGHQLFQPKINPKSRRMAEEAQAKAERKKQKDAGEAPVDGEHVRINSRIGHLNQQLEGLAVPHNIGIGGRSWQGYGGRGGGGGGGGDGGGGEEIFIETAYGAVPPPIGMRFSAGLGGLSAGAAAGAGVGAARKRSRVEDRLTAKGDEYKKRQEAREALEEEKVRQAARRTTSELEAPFPPACSSTSSLSAASSSHGSHSFSSHARASALTRINSRLQKPIGNVRLY